MELGMLLILLCLITLSTRLSRLMSIQERLPLGDLVKTDPPLAFLSRVPDQNGISQACDIVQICHSGPEPSI